MGNQFGDGEKDEKPVHEVCLDDYYIGKFEVTQGDWKTVMGNNPSKYKSRDNYPVEYVRWNEVQEFIRKLNADSDGRYRLPTEAEWEYAARNRGEKYRFSWGNDDPVGKKGGNVADESFYEVFDRWTSWITFDRDTAPVGSFEPNELGLYDMTGNVSEWCSDWYDNNYYRNSPRGNPNGPANGQYRVFRGGSWDDRVWDIRTQNRERGKPDWRNGTLGFRLVLSAR